MYMETVGSLCQSVGHITESGVLTTFKKKTIRLAFRCAAHETAVTRPSTDRASDAEDDRLEPGIYHTQNAVGI